MAANFSSLVNFRRDNPMNRFSFDPKPENETARRLSPALRCGPLDESGRRKNAEEGTHRRADHLRLAASRRRQESGRRLPGDGDIAAGVLQLEEALRGIGVERASRVAAVAGREWEAEDLGCGSESGQAHLTGSAIKKARQKKSWVASGSGNLPSE